MHNASAAPNVTFDWLSATNLMDPNNAYYRYLWTYLYYYCLSCNQHNGLLDLAAERIQSGNASAIPAFSAANPLPDVNVANFRPNELLSLVSSSSNEQSNASRLALPVRNASTSNAANSAPNCLFPKTHQSVDSRASSPCVCKHCGKRFSRLWLLQGHIRVHTGERPFRCPICSKCFADKSNMRAHVQIHSPEKPYQCSRCKKRFALKSYMKKHEESSCMRKLLLDNMKVAAEDRSSSQAFSLTKAVISPALNLNLNLPRTAADLSYCLGLSR